MSGLPHDFVANLSQLIEKNYVPRAEYEKLKKELELLQKEHARSKEVFLQKNKEWEQIKTVIQSKIPSTKDKNKLESGAAEPYEIKAPRLENKARKRMLLGGDTPPGFWNTKFTPDC